MGGNLIREATWNPLVNLLTKRLISWNYRYISSGVKVRWFFLTLFLMLFLSSSCLFENAYKGLEENNTYSKEVSIGWFLVSAPIFHHGPCTQLL